MDLSPIIFGHSRSILAKLSEWRISILACDVRITAEVLLPRAAARNAAVNGWPFRSDTLALNVCLSLACLCIGELCILNSGSSAASGGAGGVCVSGSALLEAEALTGPL